MKLINLNAWGGTKYNELINLLTSNDWDFITLQEIFALQIDSNTPVLKNGKVMNLLDLLKKNLKQQHFLFSSTAGYLFNGERVEYGNLIISKMPVRNFKTVFYDIEYIDNFSNTSNDFSNDPRNLQISEIQLGESVISILNTHGIWQLDKKKTDTDRTLKMTQTIINNANLKKPTIVCGDLNLVPNTESIAQLDKVMTNLVTKNGITNTRNQFKGVQEVVDYIFVSNLIKVNGLKMIETTASDHNALVLDFDIQK